MSGLSERRQALRASVDRARRGILIAVFATAIPYLPFALWFALRADKTAQERAGTAFIAASLLNLAILTLVFWGGVRRARRTARQLPPAEAAAVLRPLAEHIDEGYGRIARRVLKSLRPGDTELLPTGAPGGDGREVAAEEQKPRLTTPPTGQ